MASRSQRREEIAKRLDRIRSEIDDRICLIVVTKNFPISDVEILIELGEREFGENRVQELRSKRDALSQTMTEDLSAEITWHFQGQIQSNKITQLNRYADVIHSFESMKAVEGLSGDKCVFLQINLDRPNEESRGGRSGIESTEVERYAEAMAEKFGKNFLGVMAVAPHFPGITDEIVADAFARLRVLSSQVIAIAPWASAISAGMSDDYRIALEHGATHIRLGSSILGHRPSAT